MDVLVSVKAINAAVAEAQAAPTAEVAAAPVAEGEPVRDLTATLKDPFDPFELTAVCDCHNVHDGRPMRFRMVV